MGKVAAILGYEVKAKAPEVAVVRCNGTCSARPKVNEYDGYPSCKVKAALYSGDTACEYGCLGCGDCVNACPAGALRVWGEYLSVAEVMEVVERDRRYYETSGGGLTVSGGEPLVQAAFTEALLRICRAAGVQTCLESTLYAPNETLERVLVEEGVAAAPTEHQLLPMQPGDVYQTYADATELERDFGFVPKVALADGLREFARWYKRYYQTPRLS